MKIKFCLDEILEEKNVTQKQLAEMTGIREPTILTMKINSRKKLTKNRQKLTKNKQKLMKNRQK